MIKNQEKRHWCNRNNTIHNFRMTKFRTIKRKNHIFRCTECGVAGEKIGNTRLIMVIGQEDKLQSCNGKDLREELYG